MIGNNSESLLRLETKELSAVRRQIKVQSAFVHLLPGSVIPLHTQKILHGPVGGRELANAQFNKALASIWRKVYHD
jgi:hypothetical protein